MRQRLGPTRAEINHRLYKQKIEHIDELMLSQVRLKDLNKASDSVLGEEDKPNYIELKKI